MMSSLSQTRNLYQEHIKNTVRLIDLHSRLYVETGYVFHKHSYDRLVAYVCELKQHIKDAEASNDHSDVPKSWFRT